MRIDWSDVAGVSKTTATLQVVVNPLIRRGSPIHDNVFASLRALGADYVRFVPWYPYPRLSVAELDAPTDTKTSWDFSLIDPLVEDFQSATAGHSTIMDFSTIPEWMWHGSWQVREGQLHVDGGGNGVAEQGATWTDYTFAADVTPLPTATHDGGAYTQAGLLFRMAGLDGYALLISNYPYSAPAASGYAVFVRLFDGTPDRVETTPLPFAVVGGQSYRVAITTSGEQLTVSIDGATVTTVTDSSCPAGTVGFRECGAESARFGDVSVTAPDGSVLLADDFSGGLGQWVCASRLPDDPDTVNFAYTQSARLTEPVSAVADYFRRVVEWYTAGGFTDEHGRFHRSGHHYSFPYWEVLNEVEYEHWLNPESYTELYDAIVTEIRAVSPETKFVGLSLCEPRADWIRYFLDRTNHRPGVPLDMISYHFYAFGATTDTPDTYGSTGFPQAEKFLAAVDEAEVIRRELAPDVRTTVNETGAILADAATQAESAPIPSAFWNYSAAIYAYLVAELARKGIDIVGESQLVAYPSQFPSVAMVDWDTGLPNARYRVLQLLIDQLPPGSDLIPAPADASADSCYLLGLCSDGMRKVLIVNKTNDDAAVTIDGVGGALACIVDQVSGGGPIRTEVVPDDRFVLGGYGVAVLTLTDPPVSPAAQAGA